MANWKLASIISVVLGGLFLLALFASILLCKFWANRRYPKTCLSLHIIVAICLAICVVLSIVFGVVSKKASVVTPLPVVPIVSNSSASPSSTQQAQVIPAQSAAVIPSAQATLSARQAFLTRTFGVSNNTQGIDITTVKFGNMLRCPMIFGYLQYPDSHPSICMKFPAAFVSKLPSNLLSDLASHDCQSACDIFFVAQANQGGATASIKVHAWAFDIPDPPFLGSLYNQNMLIGIYSANNTAFCGEYGYQSLQQSNVNIHDSTLSPQHPTLTVPLGTLYYFWSLVIDLVAKRAAATLHWGMPFNSGLQDTAIQKQPALTNSYIGSLAAGKTIDAFLSAIHGSTIFAAYPDMLAQLDNLFT